MLLFACDLDNTLIYSHRLLGPENAVPVDCYHSTFCCYMTAGAHARLQQTVQAVRFIPVTTRSVAQFVRMKLPAGVSPQYAVVCNGGILLKDGQPDSDWLAQSREMAAVSVSLFDGVIKLMNEDRYLLTSPRIVDGLFVFAKSNCAEQSYRRIAAVLGDHPELNLSVQGSKLYVLPRTLNKGMAVRRLRERFCPDCVVCAGDGELDLPMLREADLGFVPEDYPTGPLPPQIRMLSGDRIFFADRLLAEVRALYETEAKARSVFGN